MSVGAQQVGQLGRRVGNAQLRGHLGRIPFIASTVPGCACGDLVLAAVASAAMLQASAASGDIEAAAVAVGDVQQVARARGDIELVEDALGDVETCKQ